MGFGLDKNKSRFTMDDKHNMFVADTFIKMYEKGIIYRGKKAIN
jgi:valyl-tRNA synthetase